MKPIVLFRINPGNLNEGFLKSLNETFQNEKDNFLFLVVGDENVKGTRTFEIEVHNIQDATEQTLEEFKQYIKDNYPDAYLYLQG